MALGPAADPPRLPRHAPSALQSRVLRGVRPEILALSEIPFVKAFTARLLYRAGLRRVCRALAAGPRCSRARQCRTGGASPARADADMAGAPAHARRPPAGRPRRWPPWRAWTSWCPSWPRGRGEEGRTRECAASCAGAGWVPSGWRAAGCLHIALTVNARAHLACTPAHHAAHPTSLTRRLARAPPRLRPARSDARNKALVRRQALKILRGARELLNRRARELREQAEEAFRLVESADKAELAHGEGGPTDGAAGGAAAAAAEGGGGEREDGGVGSGGARPDGNAAPHQQQQQQGAATAAAAPAAAGQGSGRAAAGSGRGAAGSGRSVQSGGGSEAGRASWRAEEGGSDGEEEDEGTLDAPAEAEPAPDPWQYGGQAGAHLLDTPEAVRQMCAVLLAPATPEQQQPGQQAQAQQQQQGQQQRHPFFGFHFDVVATGSASGAAALLPKGPTAAQRRDNAAHDKQSAGGWVGCASGGGRGRLLARTSCCGGPPPPAGTPQGPASVPSPPLPPCRPCCACCADVGWRLEGVALSWRSGQAFYVPLHRRPDLLAELAPAFASPVVEKATWDLRGQLSRLVRVLGRGVLGTPGAAPDPGACAASGAAGGVHGGWCRLLPAG